VCVCGRTQYKCLGIIRVDSEIIDQRLSRDSEFVRESIEVQWYSISPVNFKQICDSEDKYCICVTC
jgi:hypothetical protein